MPKFMIKGQIIKGLYRSSREGNWALMETDRATYELVLGGLKITKERPSPLFSLDMPVAGKEIKLVKTDQFIVYIELDSGECLVHSDSFINAEGSTDFVLSLWSKSDFDAEKRDWYDADTDLEEIE